MNYQEIDAVNQSFLKALYYKGLSALRQEDPTLFYEEKEHFLLGNMFDTIMTDPGQYRKKFFVSELEEKPSATLMSVINKAVTLRRDDIIENNLDIILQAMDSEGWHVGKGEKRLEYKAWKECNASVYWEELILSIGREIVSKAQHDKVMDAVIRVKETIPFMDLVDHINVRNQVVLQGEYYVVQNFDPVIPMTGVPIKGIVDQLILKVDNQDKWSEIVKAFNVDTNTNAIVIDYKTYSGLSKNYRYAIRKYRYDVQMAFYKFLVKQNYGNFANKMDALSPDAPFRIETFNVVANLNSDEPSFAWHYQDEDLAIAEYGAWQPSPNEYHVCSNAQSDYSVAGFDTMILRYLWYKSNNFNVEYGFSNNMLKTGVWND